MESSRRRFLWNVGKVLVVVAGGAYALRRCDALPGSAIEAWEGPADDEEDIRRWALSYAILAPSNHNMQPWKFDLQGSEERIRLYIDEEHLLPVMDPYLHQALIDLGGVIESLVIAASHKNYRVEVQYFPEGSLSRDRPSSKPVADIRLIADATVTEDPLFPYLLQRRSNRQLYQSTPLSTEHRTALQAAMATQQVQLDFVTDPAEVEAVRLLTVKALGVTMTTADTMQETVANTRIGGSSINEARDGIALHGPLIWWLQKSGRLSAENAATPGSMGYNAIFGDAAAPLMATPGFVLFQNAGHAPEGQLAMGRAYLRFNVWATQLGVSVQPVNHVLIEHPAMAETQAEFYQTLNKSRFRVVQMLVRIGYALEDIPAPTARRPLQDSLLTE